MADGKRVVPLRKQHLSGDVYGLRIGTVVGTDEDGRALVSFRGLDQDRAAACVTTCAKEKLLRGCLAGREVLLGFDNGDSSSIPYARRLKIQRQTRIAHWKCINRSDLSVPGL